MHHGSEGESGDETAQEVLNTHAQDSHTWGNKHTRAKSWKNRHNNTSTSATTVFFWKKAEKYQFYTVVCSATLLTTLFYVEVKVGRQSSEKR